jgi:hypothetical protein
VDWAAVRAGRSPKQELVRTALALRARRAGAFAVSYDPVEAGEHVCAYTRGGEVLVAVAVRGDLQGFRPPPGAWRDVARTETFLLAERG